MQLSVLACESNEDLVCDNLSTQDKIGLELVLPEGLVDDSAVDQADALVWSLDKSVMLQIDTSALTK